MGTNYYFREPKCECCGRQGEGLHIGKSSAGWCFSLRVHSDPPISTLDEWVAYIEDNPNCVIMNEYGDTISKDELLSTITDRSWNRTSDPDPDFLRRNYARLGPNGLLRHGGPHVQGNGEGTWDYIEGEFS